MRKVYLIEKNLIKAATFQRNGRWRGAIVKGGQGQRYSKRELNLGITFLNDGIPEPLEVSFFFNITYYPLFQNAKKHILGTSYFAST